jgi:hypothetical protein
MTDLLDAALAKMKTKSEPFVFGAPSIVPKEPEPLPLFDLTDAAIDAATLAERDAIVTDLKEWGMLRLPFDIISIRFHGERVAKECGFAPIAKCKGIYYTMTFAAFGKPSTLETMYTVFEPPSENLLAPRRKWTKEEIETAKLEGRYNERVVVRSEIFQNVIAEYPNGGVRVWNLAEIDAERPGIAADYVALGCEALTILLASLAARNVVKDVRYNANNKTTGDVPRYISNGVTYLSRTVIKPPRADQLETERGGLSNGKLEIRLVRGHKRQVVADTTKPQPADVRVTVVGAGRTGRREQWIAPYYVNADAEFLKVPRYKVAA